MADRYKQKEILFFRGGGEGVKTLKRVGREHIDQMRQTARNKKKAFQQFFQKFTFDNSIHLIANLRIKERKSCITSPTRNTVAHFR